jgi:hypothetical protein
VWWQWQDHHRPAQEARVQLHQLFLHPQKKSAVLAAAAAHLAAAAQVAAGNFSQHNILFQ